MSGPISVVAIIAIIVITFPTFWVFAIFATSRIGGWSGMASHYSASSIPTDNGRGWVHLYMKPSRFRQATYAECIRVRIDRDAMYLSTQGLFKPFHIPLRLLFDDMSITEKGQSSIRHLRAKVWKSVEFDFLRESKIELSLRQKDFDWVMEVRDGLIR